PTPTITSISPASGTKGTTQTVTFTGTNFVSGSGTTVKISAGGVTASNVNVQSDTSLTATFTIPADATAGTYFVFVSTPQGGDSNSVTVGVNPHGPAITYGIPQLLNPTQQVPVQLTLATALPDSVTGQMTLTFNPNATNNADDPNATFVGAEASARSIGFTFPPNTTTAQFSLTNTVLQAGTV